MPNYPDSDISPATVIAEFLAGRDAKSGSLLAENDHLGLRSPGNPLKIIALRIQLLDGSATVSLNSNFWPKSIGIMVLHEMLRTQCATHNIRVRDLPI